MNRKRFERNTLPMSWDIPNIFLEVNLDYIVDSVKQLKIWVISTLDKLFSNDKHTLSIPKINLDFLHECQDWYEKMKLLTACIKFKDYGRALECLKELCFVHSKYQQCLLQSGIKNWYNTKSMDSFDLLPELILFCQDGIEILSNFPVKKLMLQTKIKNNHKHGCILKSIRNQHRFGKSKKNN